MFMLPLQFNTLEAIHLLRWQLIFLLIQAPAGDGSSYVIARVPPLAGVGFAKP